MSLLRPGAIKQHKTQTALVNGESGERSSEETKWQVLHKDSDQQANKIDIIIR